MKKVLCLLLSVVMLLSLAACGKGDVTSPTDDPVVEDTTPDVEPPVEDIPDDTLPENTDYYQLKDGVSPVMGPTSYEEVEFENAEGLLDVVKVSTTPLNFDIESAMLNLQANPFVAEKYPQLYSYRKEANQPQYQDNVQYNLMWDTAYIVDGSDEFMPRFKVQATRLRDYYANPMAITVEMHMETASLKQDDVLSVLKILYPAEIADYLVYGKDLDNKTIDGEDLINEFTMEELVAVGDCSYEVERRVNEIDGYLYLTYIVGISTNNYLELHSHAFSDECWVYESNDYTTDALFSQNVPMLTPSNYEDFAAALFKDLDIDYNYVRIDSWSFVNYTTPNNVRDFETTLAFTVYNSANEREASFTSQIRASEKDGALTYHAVNIDLWTAKLLKEDIKQHSELMANKYQAMLDGLEIGEVVIDANYDNNCSASATITMNDVEYMGTMDTHYANTPMMTLRLEYWGS